MKSVKWIGNGAGHGFGYFAGNVAQLPDAVADKLQHAGLVVIIPPTITQFAPPKQTPKPVHLR